MRLTRLVFRPDRCLSASPTPATKRLEDDDGDDDENAGRRKVSRAGDFPVLSSVPPPSSSANNMTMRAVIPGRRDSTAPKSGKAMSEATSIGPQPFLRWTGGKTLPFVEKPVADNLPTGESDDPFAVAPSPSRSPPATPRLDRPPPRPRRPDSLDKDSLITLADTLSPVPSPALKSSSKFDNVEVSSLQSTFADLEVQFDDIISTYSTAAPIATDGAVPPPRSPSTDSAEEGSPTTPRATVSAPASDPASRQVEAIQAKLAELGMDAIDTRPAKVKIAPGSERAQTLVSLERRTAHLASTPLYTERLALLQRLEVAMGAFLRVEDAENILLIEKRKQPEEPTSPTSPRTEQLQRSMLGRIRTSWRAPPRPSPVAPPRPDAVFGVPLSNIPADAFVEATLAGQPYELPIVCFAAVEEIYRRGQGAPVQSFMTASGSATRRDQLVRIYETEPDFGERHDLSLESIHDVVALLKHFLSALPSPVLDERLQKLFVSACIDSPRPLESRIDCAQLILRLLPARNLHLLLYLVAGFSQLPLCSRNAVAPEKIASIFGPALLASRVPAHSPSSRRSSLSISGPTDLGTSPRKAAENAEIAMRWLLEHWSAVAEGLLAATKEDAVAQHVQGSTDTLHISLADSKEMPVARSFVEAASETASQTACVELSGSQPEASNTALRGVSDDVPLDATPRPASPSSEPSLSPSQSRSSTCSDSVETPAETGSPHLRAEDADEANVALQKQLDEAIAMLTVRRPSADDPDNASLYAFPAPPPGSLAEASAPHLHDPLEAADLPSTKKPVAPLAHRRTQSADASTFPKPLSLPISRSLSSASRTRTPLSPTWNAPPIPEEGVPPPVPLKRRSLGSPPSASAASKRLSLQPTPRTGTRNLLLPTHVRRYDEIVLLRQQVATLERERKAERDDMANLRNEVEAFKARTAKRLHSEEEDRIARAEQRTLDAEARAADALRQATEWRNRLVEAEHARKRDASEARKTALELENQLRELKTLMLERP